MLKDSDCIHFAGQAVNLLILYVGIFYAPTLGYWRLPIRKIYLSFGVNYYLSAAYMVTAIFCCLLIF
nr:MAG TPA: hypothetical protein [Caudoviricetes sp.]